MRFHKILCPIDFSDGSLQAMHTAIRLAKEGDAELILLHTWEIPAIALSENVIPATTFQRLSDAGEQGLATAVREAERLGARVTSRLLEGSAWRSVLDVASADPKIDLIVLGTQGRTGLSRVLLGSTAERVVRHAHCPVLVVRPGNEPRPFVHALCPTDFGPSARDALRMAGELVQPGGAGIEILHVLEIAAAYSGEPRPDVIRDIDRRSTEELERTAAEVRAGARVPVGARTRVGWAGAEILRALENDQSIDLVVMGSHGRTGIGRFLLGSVAEKVVRHAHCPVLVMHRGA
jgi:nucleotide-binding universal stress UspA family protein